MIVLTCVLCFMLVPLFGEDSVLDVFEAVSALKSNLWCEGNYRKITRECSDELNRKWFGRK